MIMRHRGTRHVDHYHHAHYGLLTVITSLCLTRLALAFDDDGGKRERRSALPHSTQLFSHAGSIIIT